MLSRSLFYRCILVNVLPRSVILFRLVLDPLVLAWNGGFNDLAV